MGRSSCTADKKSLYCKRCKIAGHSYEACRRGRRATRSPSRSGYTTRSSAPSPASSSSEEPEQEEKKKKKHSEKQRRSRRDKKSQDDPRQKRASSHTTSASRSRSNSKTRGKPGRTPKTKRKVRDTVNMIDETSDFSESQSTMRATRKAYLKQDQSAPEQMCELKITLDTGSRFNILDEEEALSRGWKVDKLTDWQEPCLRYADGRKMPITGKVTLWICLSKDQNKRKIELFVSPNLQSKMIIGLIDLKRLGWTTPQWPLDIERYQTLFQTPSTDDESDDDVVNNITDTTIKNNQIR